MNRKPSIEERMRRLGISEEDFEEAFSRSSGPGGQHVNKVSTAVTLSYPARKIAVTVQDSRSQAMNRQLARERLLDAIERANLQERQERRAAIEKARRQNAKRPRMVKERMLEGKRRRSDVKRTRGRVGE